MGQASLVARLLQHGEFGAGDIQRSVTNYELTIDREAYAAGVMNGVQNFNGEVAKVAAAAKP